MKGSIFSGDRTPAFSRFRQGFAIPVPVKPNDMTVGDIIRGAKVSVMRGDGEVIEFTADISLEINDGKYSIIGERYLESV